jgi:5,10-methylene-tetrahydrofolate dehydrogenase/methenyl tetrahydrofolate cyclohydrolase
MLTDFILRILENGFDMSIPATPYGILELLDRYGVETKGKHTVVIGRSHCGKTNEYMMGRKGFLETQQLL